MAKSNILIRPFKWFFGLELFLQIIIVFIVIPICLPLLIIAILRGARAIAEHIQPEEKRLVRLADPQKQIRESLEKWRQENMNLPTFRFTDLSIKENHVWAVGHRMGYHGYSRLLHSSDNGQTWKVQYSDNRADFFQLHFFNRRQGLVTSGLNVLETSDGGKTWHTLLTVRNMPGLAIHAIKKITAQDRNHLVVRLRGDLRGAIETEDKGRTWRYAIYHGQYYGSRTVKLQTQNQGLTWENSKRAELPFSFQKGCSIIQENMKKLFLASFLGIIIVFLLFALANQALAGLMDDSPPVDPGYDPDTPTGPYVEPSTPDIGDIPPDVFDQPDDVPDTSDIPPDIPSVFDEPDLEDYLPPEIVLPGGTLGDGNTPRAGCPEEGLVPCGTPGCPCTFCDIFVMFDRIVDFILFRIIPPVAALMLAIGGFLYILAFANPEGAGPERLSKAKTLFKAVMIGLLIVYAAWIIVNTFFMMIGVNDWTGLREGWWTIECP